MNGPGAVAYTRRAGKGRRYTALTLLFILPLSWIAIGAWLLPAGLGFRSQVEPVAGWAQTTGRIVSFKTYLPSYGKTPIYPAVIAFRAAGHLVTFSTPGLPDPPTLGSPVRVAYDPGNPADAHDLSARSAWESHVYVPVGFLAFGIGLLAFLSWLVFVRRKLTHRALVAAPFSSGRHVGVFSAQIPKLIMRLSILPTDPTARGRDALTPLGAWTQRAANSEHCPPRRSAEVVFIPSCSH